MEGLLSTWSTPSSFYYTSAGLVSYTYLVQIGTATTVICSRRPVDCYSSTTLQLQTVFKGTALWANAFYKLKFPSACPSVHLSVRLSVCLSIRLSFHPSVNNNCLVLDVINVLSRPGQRFDPVFRESKTIFTLKLKCTK